MRNLFKFFFILGFLCVICNKSFSQFTVSFYSSSLSKIGLGYDFPERFRAELRLYSNTKIEDITPELVLCYNMVEKEKHNVYIGLGANANYFTGFVLPVGVQFSPFEKLEKFSFLIELQPTLDIQDTDHDLIIQSAWGLRYKFGK